LAGKPTGYLCQQANIANGPQQVNNGTPASPEKLNPPNKFLEQGNEQRMDTPAEGPPGTINLPVEALGVGNRP
jgi:hypothetical protein